MIDVIVPIYKVEKYLKRCIDSIVHQTYKDIKTILSDDGSPDGCAAICDESALNDERIIVVHRVNKGVSSARNAGLDISCGKYIGFVDPDDWTAPEMYGEMLKAIQSNKVEMVICGYDYYDESGKIDNGRCYVIKENEIISQKEIMRRFADMPPSIRHGVCNKCFNKSLLDEHGIRFNEKLHSSEDVLFLTEYTNIIKNAVIIHQPLYKNTVRQGSATHGGLNLTSLADSYYAHEYMYNSSIEKYKDLKNYCMAFLLDACMLKYVAAKKHLQNNISVSPDDIKRLNEMKSFIKHYALKAIFNKEIYWKTRIMYLLFQ